jgi:hypothetical protein
MLDSGEGFDESANDPELERERAKIELSRPTWWQSALIQQLPFVGPFIAEYQKAMWQDEADRYFLRANQRALARVVNVLEDIRSRVDLQAEEIVQRLNEDERLADMLNRALRAAARTGLGSKRRALSMVLANAISDADDARIDEAELLVAALAQLEAAHVRVIGLLYEVEPFRTKKSTVDGLKITHPELSGCLEALLLQLLGWGLVRTELRRPLDRRGIPQRYVELSDLERAEDFMLTDLGVQVCGLLLTGQSSQEGESGRRENGRGGEAMSP